MATRSNFRIRLSQLPVDDNKSDDVSQELNRADVIEDVIYSVRKEGILKYTNLFLKKWEGSLKGYTVETRIASYNGTIRSDGEWLYLKDCSDLTLLTDISLSYELPVSTETSIGKIPEMNYKELLKRHVDIHSEMFKRFSLSFGDNEEMDSNPGSVDPKLIFWESE